MEGYCLAQAISDILLPEEKMKASVDGKSLKKKILPFLCNQLWLVLVHLVNLCSVNLGDDYISCKFRRLLLQILGVKIGEKTVIKGGGYFYGGKLSVGKFCHINRGCYFDFTSSISLGDNVVVGHGVTFITAKHRIAGASRRAGIVSGQPIMVEDGVWLGANATLLPGITMVVEPLLLPELSSQRTLLKIRLLQVFLRQSSENWKI